MLSGKLVTDWNLVYSLCWEQSFLRMKLSTTIMNFFAFKWFVFVFKIFCYFGKEALFKIIVHIDKDHSASTKNKPSWLDFCYPDVLKTWQQSIPKLGVKNEWTIAIIKESGLWEIQRWPLGFFQFPDKPLFFFLMG